MRQIDWAVLVVFAFGVLSPLFSQIGANKVVYLEAIAVAILVYFAIRVTTRKTVHVGWGAGLIGIGGAWLALCGMLPSSLKHPCCPSRRPSSLKHPCCPSRLVARPVAAFATRPISACQGIR